MDEFSEEEKIEMIMGEFYSSIFFYNPEPITYIEITKRIGEFINQVIRSQKTMKDLYDECTRNSIALSDKKILDGIKTATEKAGKKNHT